MKSILPGHQVQVLNKGFPCVSCMQRPVVVEPSLLLWHVGAQGWPLDQIQCPAAISAGHWCMKMTADLAVGPGHGCCRVLVGGATTWLAVRLGQGTGIGGTLSGACPLVLTSPMLEGEFQNSIHQQWH